MFNQFDCFAGFDDDEKEPKIDLENVIEREPDMIKENEEKPKRDQDLSDDN